MDAAQQYTARKFQKQMRRSEAEQSKNTQSNFDLQIYCNYLKNEVLELRKQQRRRSARSPIPVENFYDQYTDHPENEAPVAVRPYNYESTSPMLEPPRRESDARSFNAYSETSGRGGGGSQVSVPPPTEIAFSRQMFEEELAEVMRKKDTLEKQVTKEIMKSSTLEARVDELKQELATAKEIHRQELSYLASVRTELEDKASVKSKELEQQLLVKEAAERRASLAEAKANELTAKYDKASMQLNAERQRIEEWEKSRQKELGESGPILNQPGDLDALLKDMDTQRYKLDNAKYSKTWRDDVLRNMNLCLRVLYACEHEVVEKRSVFVQRSCAATAQCTRVA